MYETAHAATGFARYNTVCCRGHFRAVQSGGGGRSVGGNLMALTRHNVVDLLWTTGGAAVPPAPTRQCYTLTTQSDTGHTTHHRVHVHRLNSTTLSPVQWAISDYNGHC